MIKMSKVLIELIDIFLCIADIVTELDMGRGEEEILLMFYIMF